MGISSEKEAVVDYAWRAESCSSLREQHLPLGPDASLRFAALSMTVGSFRGRESGQGSAERDLYFVADGWAGAIMTENLTRLRQWNGLEHI